MPGLRGKENVVQARPPSVASPFAGQIENKNGVISRFERGINRRRTAGEAGKLNIIEACACWKELTVLGREHATKREREKKFL